jgi:hypothetical protein
MTLLHLLRIDSTAGLTAGALVLLAQRWLADLYALPLALIIGIGVANLAYGTASGSLLLLRPRQLPRLVRLLAIANILWAAGCIALGVRWFGIASPFGLAQLFGEGLLVGALGVVEWRASHTARVD